MAKTKPTKRPAKAKQQLPGDVEVTVCRRRGDRRNPAARTTAVAKTAAAATAAKPSKTSKTTKTAKTSKAPGAAKMESEQESKPVFVPGERRKKVPRRRQIDPTTCERDYTGDEIEFMHALDAYKRSSGRMFPTCSEILEVVRGLGYVRLFDGEEVAVGALAKDADSISRSDADVSLTL